MRQGRSTQNGIEPLGLHGTVAFDTVLGYAFFFYLGMLASHTQWTPSARMAGTSALCVALVVVALIAMPATHSVLVGGAGQNGIYLQWNDLANAVLSIMVMPLTIRSAEIKADQLDRMLGDMSYGVYLMHSPLVGIYNVWFGNLPLLQRLPYWVALLLVVVGAAWLAWKLVDQPVMAWRERYLAART